MVANEELAMSEWGVKVISFLKEYSRRPSRIECN